MVRMTRSTYRRKLASEGATFEGQVIVIESAAQPVERVLNTHTPLASSSRGYGASARPILPNHRLPHHVMLRHNSLFSAVDKLTAATDWRCSICPLVARAALHL